MRVIYADSVIIINFTVNYILLLVTAKISAATISRGKLIAAALFGAVYALFAEIWFGSFLNAVMIKIAVAAAMLLIAFNDQSAYLKKMLVFISVASAFAGASYFASSLTGGESGGVMTAALDIRVLIISFAICYFVFSVVFRNTAKAKTRDIVGVTIKRGNSKTEFSALLDSGCSLYDPITNSPVLIAKADILIPILPNEVNKAIKEANNAVSFIELLSETEYATMFRLLPYNAVGVEMGMLAAFRPDRVEIDGKHRKNMLVAVTKTAVSGGVYHALIGI